ncbi:MAG: NF038122 family metalloprotease [Bacteroidota bacterium]
MFSLRLPLVLAAAVFLSAAASGQDSAPITHAGIHVLTVGPDGVQCDHAAENALMAQKAYSKTDDVRLTALPSLNAGDGDGFRIILRATDQLLAEPEALLAFRRSAARWEQIIQTPVTTVIDVDYGTSRFGTPYPSPNILGSTGSAERATQLTSADVVARFQERTTDPDLLALYNAIPIPTPSTATNGDGSTANLGRLVVGTIPGQVLGVLPAQLDPDPQVTPFGSVPTIGFNSSFTFDFDPRDGVRGGAIDFEGVAMHEIGHALGFVTIIGGGGPPNNFFAPWDLFRVRPDEVEPGESYTDGTGWEVTERVITPGPPNTEVIATINGRDFFAAVQTSFFGDVEYETSTATGGRQGGDGQQGSHWRDDQLRLPSLGTERKIGIMDPNLSFGSRDEIELPDIRLLDAIGYNVVYEPAFADAQFALDGTVLDTESTLLIDEIFLGDAGEGEQGSVTLQISNLDGTTPLDYAIEFESEGGLPVGTTPVFSVSAPAGVLEPGASTDVTLEFSAAGDLGFFFGRLLLRTNDESQLVVDLPVAFTVGGARIPELTVTDPSQNLGAISSTEATTFEVVLENTGSFPIAYSVESALTPQDILFDTDPTSRRLDETVLFTADFDDGNGIDRFLGASTGTEGWRETQRAPADADGHSTPTAAHFGLDVEREGQPTILGYRDNQTGLLLTPDLSLAPYDQTDIISVSLNYYLDVQDGDVASLVYSFDDGASFETITTSNGGLLVNDGAWRSLSVPVQGIAGAPDRIRFGFLFGADGSATATGWLIDDVQIAVDRGGAFSSSVTEGVVGGEDTDTITFTVDGRFIEAGFYSAEIDIEPSAAPGAEAFADRIGDLDPITVEFTAGASELPGLSVPSQPLAVAPGADSFADFTLNTSNPSSAGVTTYLRVVQPAIEAFETGQAGTPAAPESPTDEASVELPGAGFPFGLVHLPDGRLLVSDVQTNDLFVVSADFSTATVVDGPAGDSRISGLAWNPLTESIWATEFNEIDGEFAIREGTLSGTSFDYTGNQILTDFASVGLAYAPELDAYFTVPFQSDEVYAYGSDGDILPGYPFIPSVGLDGQFPGVSWSAGVLEFSVGDDLVRAADQFGRVFDGGVDYDLSGALVGASSARDVTRSLDDPEGRAFALTSEGDGSTFRVVAFDPPDFPEDFTPTRIFAREPLGDDQALGPGQAVSLSLRADTRGLDGIGFDDEVVFLVNNPGTPLVRFPVLVNGGKPISTEEGDVSPFRMVGAIPNPIGSGGVVRFQLAEAAEVTVAVFNVLGQRVAVLAQDTPLAAGVHDLPLRAEDFAAGTYLVRVIAGQQSAARTLTVVR